jgi:hypothetical protein
MTAAASSSPDGAKRSNNGRQANDKVDTDETPLGRFRVLLRSAPGGPAYRDVVVAVAGSVSATGHGGTGSARGSGAQGEGASSKEDHDEDAAAGGGKDSIVLQATSLDAFIEVISWPLVVVLSGFAVRAGERRSSTAQLSN